ncbi:peptide-methionine (R)-S-oxide reductase MsrB [Myroides odoratimimus]|uniref:peptide-methionine (R)-S-oxide reductase MsrB n=1 Tax=Myroides odoratimimus TaxID=76832 RepID=UPI002577F39F|nr:peptide-methionine (R)-S-oxide reductase MsrB [Myroides odoratimimus]MDM1467599.1 peptide-methionine (R)-S-oxide reductase MsrB [Myroides odoratimimus]MDM1470706.1 peptide-methionine (R)-S-oxide reductase MsrB [Myroides odoratimimus]MDM1480878.1 peptide-methionine (R)-S-oxide reductase MsrB [Myroides odoratimimus]
MKIVVFGCIILSILACKDVNYQKIPKMKKDKTTTEQEWQQALTPTEYYVLREKGTERPFTGEYNDFNEKGTYHCAGCGQLLFSSDTKFDAHCGWPSFDKAIEGSVTYIEDLSHGMKRIEVTCSNCNGHLGHIFPDGPTETTGMRYCMNSISLKFKKQE